MTQPTTKTPSNRPIRVLAVTRKPESASFQQRVLNYIDLLAQQQISVDWRQLPAGLIRQASFFEKLDKFDVIWWQRHLLHPLWLPRLSKHASRIVFGFDDPITHSAADGGRPSLTRRIRFAALLRRCDAAITASEHLAEIARRYCDRVMVVPMAVDAPASVVQIARRPGPLQLLWLGSRATQSYLDVIAPVLAELGRRRPDVMLRVVGHEPVEFGPLKVDFRKWSPQEQEAALRQCHVGLCPMPDTVWTRGKCPYKVLQYMAYGMPWVGSAVGENIAFAGNGTRGLCADGDAAWLRQLEYILDQPERRQVMATAGRAYIRDEHARSALAHRIAELFRNVMSGPSNAARSAA